MERSTLLKTLLLSIYPIIVVGSSNGSNTFGLQFISSSCLIHGDFFTHYKIYNVNKPSILKFYNFTLQYIDWTTLRYTSPCKVKQARVVCEINYKGFMPWYLRVKAVAKSPSSLLLGNNSSSNNTVVYSQKSYFSLLNTFKCECNLLPISPFVSIKQQTSNPRQKDLVTVTWRQAASGRSVQKTGVTKEIITIVKTATGLVKDVTHQCDTRKKQCVLRMPRNSSDMVCVTATYQHCRNGFKRCRYVNAKQGQRTIHIG